MKPEPYLITQVYDDETAAKAEEVSLHRHHWLVWGAQNETAAIVKLSKLLDRSPDLFNATLLGSPFCSECGERLCENCGDCHQHDLTTLDTLLLIADALFLIKDYLSEIYWLFIAVLYKTFFQVLCWIAVGFLVWLFTRIIL